MIYILIYFKKYIYYVKISFMFSCLWTLSDPSNSSNFKVMGYFTSQIVVSLGLHTLEKLLRIPLICYEVLYLLNRFIFFHLEQLILMIQDVDFGLLHLVSPFMGHFQGIAFLLGYFTTSHFNILLLLNAHKRKYFAFEFRRYFHFFVELHCASGNIF